MISIKNTITEYPHSDNPKVYRVHHVQKWLEKIAQKAKIKVFNEGTLTQDENGVSTETLRVELHTGEHAYFIYAQTSGSQETSVLECSVRQKGIVSTHPIELFSGKLCPDSWHEIRDQILGNELKDAE